MFKIVPVPEGSPFSPRQVWLLKISIAIMTALLILGILALIYGMTRQASRVGNTAQTAPAALQPYDRTLDLGQANLAGVSASNGFLMLHLKGVGRDTIIVLDTRDGHEVGRIQVPGSNCVTCNTRQLVHDELSCSKDYNATHVGWSVYLLGSRLY